MKNIIFLCFLLASSIIGQNATAQSQEINNLLTAYYDVKNALVADDGTLANEKSLEFVKILSNVKIDKMTAKEQKTWQEYAEKIKSDVEHIAETKDAGHQRDHFNDLSNNLFAVAKAFKINTKEVHQQYCPMKKAYWLSESSDIKNPYYGKKMLTCGKVTETLKVIK
ncbi:MAG: DUF3347 domain-containing protein [Sphingobacteriales bacterium]|nr:MAG: DUF3347 domain-containing protein [Sphingobacteriales bacterium]